MTVNSNKYIECLCPSCLEEIYIGDCKIVSEISRMVLKDKPRPEDQDYFRQYPEPLVGQYALALGRRQCPLCDYLLPPNYEDIPNIVIAIVGDTFSGKTHFITALINELENIWVKSRYWPANTRISLKNWTSDVRDDYRLKEEDLFKNRNMLGRTPQGGVYMQPLIYSLSIAGNSFLNKKLRTYNILLYDLSGEDFANNHRLVAQGKFALKTDAFIFVADPIPMYEVFNALPPALQAYRSIDANHTYGRQPENVIRQVTDIFQQLHAGRPERRLSDVPIAVMVSKSDIFRHVTRRPELFGTYNYHFWRIPRYGGNVDLADLDLVHKEVRQLLLYYGQQQLVYLINTLGKNTRYFASSATGSIADDTDKFQHSITPCRCLDPFLWILHQLRIIG